MKTDKELLELAAKAAGVEFIEHCNRGIATKRNGPVLHGIWNPLADDGDALRLAVKLKIDALPSWGADCACIIGGGDSFHERQLPDEYASMRRAIVRAAAAIGESK